MPWTQDEIDAQMDDGDEDDFWDMQCGLDDRGQCSLAGTETCDFECPYRDTPAYAGYVRPAREKRQRAKRPPMKGEIATLPDHIKKRS